MISLHDINGAKFVMSKDELTYAEVIEDFPNAKRIYILTYNISKDKTALLKAVGNSQNDTEICIVSNIPNRWENYFGDNYARVAKKNISLYKRKLDPQNISEKAETYFCFANHAKIIMTDNIVYVGSSNFSEESANNFETGFISRDSGFIGYLEDVIFPWIIENSVPHDTDDELLFLNTAIRQSIGTFMNLYEELHQVFYRIADHRGHETWYYNDTENLFNPKHIETVGEICTNYLTLLERINMVFNMPLVQEEKVVNLDDDISLTEDIVEQIKNLLYDCLYELAHYDEEECINQYIDEHYAEAYDENLDEYMEKGMQLATDSFYELAQSAHEYADELLECISELKTVSQNVLVRFEKLPFGKIKIDNT